MKCVLLVYDTYFYLYFFVRMLAKKTKYFVLKYFVKGKSTFKEKFGDISNEELDKN